MFADRLRATSSEQDGDTLAMQAAVMVRVAVAATRAVVRLVRRNPDMPASQRLRLLHDTFAFVRVGCTEHTGAGGQRVSPASA